MCKNTKIDWTFNWVTFKITCIYPCLFWPFPGAPGGVAAIFVVLKSKTNFIMQMNNSFSYSAKNRIRQTEHYFRYFENIFLKSKITFISISKNTFIASPRTFIVCLTSNVQHSWMPSHVYRHIKFNSFHIYRKWNFDGRKSIS